MRPATTVACPLAVSEGALVLADSVAMAAAAACGSAPVLEYFAAPDGVNRNHRRSRTPGTNPAATGDSDPATVLLRLVESARV